MQKLFFITVFFQCFLVQILGATEKKNTNLAFNFKIATINSTTLAKKGGDLDKKFSPRCTFNWVIAAIAIKNGIITSTSLPSINISENITTNLKWQGKHTPRTWAEVSCVPYSRYIAREIGWHQIRKELEFLKYGNRKFEAESSALNFDEKPWIDGALKISVSEQIKVLDFILNSPDYLTPEQKTLLLAIFEQKDQQLPTVFSFKGKIYGKTGAGDADKKQNLKGGWFIGAYKDNNGKFIPFACYGEEVAEDYSIALKAKQHVLQRVAKIQNAE